MERYATRLARHAVELRVSQLSSRRACSRSSPRSPQHLPRYLARFASRLLSSSSASVLSTPTINETELWRDQFGFRKLIVLTTSTGKAFALDSASGAVIWSRLIGASSKEGGSVDVKGAWVTRAAQSGETPRVVIVASSSEPQVRMLLSNDPVGYSSSSRFFISHAWSLLRSRL